MSVTEPDKILTPWASSGLKNTIPETANPVTGNAGYDQGFPAINMTAKEAGGIPPFGQDFNGIFFSITEILQYMQSGGLPTYSSSLSTKIGGYPLGAILLRADGTGLWRNIKSNNTSDPDGGGSGWATDGSGSYARGLNLSSTGTSPAVSISAGMMSLDPTSGAGSISFGQISLTASVAGTGINGLDSGVASANTWYSVWVISNGDSVASLLSLSSTSPTMPPGYVYRRRIGWIRTDGTANKYPLSFIQKGNRVQYVVSTGSNVPSVRVMASGVAGSTATPTFAPVSVAAFTPPTATEIESCLSVYSGSAAQAFCAPNSSYGSHASTNPPPVSFTQSTGQATGAIPFSLILESGSLFWASTSASAILYCIGWRDSL